jgi:hypothetical protein
VKINLNGKFINLNSAASPPLLVFSPQAKMPIKAKNLLKDFHVMVQKTELFIGFFSKPPALVGEKTPTRGRGKR